MGEGKRRPPSWDSACDWTIISKQIGHEATFLTGTEGAEMGKEAGKVRGKLKTQVTGTQSSVPDRGLLLLPTPRHSEKDSDSP